MEKLIIRNAESKDLKACLVVETTCFPEEEAASEQSIAKRIDIFSQGFLVAERKGRIVGIINSGATDKQDISDEEFKALVGHDSQGKNMVIFSLAVSPDFQKQGIAEGLMKSFIAQSKNMGKKNILLLCKEPLIHYYAKFGFKDMGLSASTHGGAKWHEMALNLY